MEANDEQSKDSLDDAQRDADERIDELADEGRDMEERLDQAGSEAEDVDVPDAEDPGAGGIALSDLSKEESEDEDDGGA